MYGDVREELSVWRELGPVTKELARKTFPDLFRVRRGVAALVSFCRQHSTRHARLNRGYFLHVPIADAFISNGARMKLIGLPSTLDANYC